METYNEAIKRPKEGYKYSNDIQQTAQLSEMIANKHCLRPYAVFEWAKRHNVPLLKYMPFLMGRDTLLKANSLLLEDILNDRFDAIKQE